MAITLAPVSPSLPLLTAFELAGPDRLCGVWLDGGHLATPFPVRIASPAGWRTLLIGADLGQLLGLVDAALVDAGAGPVRLSSTQLLSMRTLELVSPAGATIHPAEPSTPESLLYSEVAWQRSRIRYLG